MIAIEGGGENLLARRIRHEITCDLPGDKLIVGQVLIERLHDPISPCPHGSVAIILIAISVCVPRHIQPLDCHALAIVFAL